MHCDDLERWDGGYRREAQMGGNIYILIVDSCCCTAEITQYCKTINLQLKKKKKNGINTGEYNQPQKLHFKSL